MYVYLDIHTDRDIDIHSWQRVSQKWGNYKLYHEGGGRDHQVRET